MSAKVSALKLKKSAAADYKVKDMTLAGLASRWPRKKCPA